MNIVERFEPARAAVRPRECDERSGCWVKTGPKGYTRGSFAGGKCAACSGSIVLAGNEAAHRVAMVKAIELFKQETSAERGNLETKEVNHEKL